MIKICGNIGYQISDTAQPLGSTPSRIFSASPSYPLMFLSTIPVSVAFLAWLEAALLFSKFWIRLWKQCGMAARRRTEWTYVQDCSHHNRQHSWLIDWLIEEFHVIQ